MRQARTKCRYYFIDADNQSETGKWIDKSLKGTWVREGFTNMSNDDPEESIPVMLEKTMRKDRN